MSQYTSLLITATWQTLYMTGFSLLLSYIIGLPLGVLIYMTDRDSISSNRIVNLVFGWVINILRSIPFIILMIALIPFTRLLLGKAIGPSAAVVSLTIAAAPFVARLVESSLSEIDPGLVLCSKAMGATNMQIITKVLLPETLPSLIRGASIAAITLVAYTAMAGAVGGGGLGDVAIRYGYHRYQSDVMLITIVILVVIVQIIQIGFSYLAKHLDKNI